MSDKHVLSNRHEEEFAQVIPGGDRTIASGAKYDKHDVKTEKTEENAYWRFRYELKYTQSKSYRFILEDWQAIQQYVALQGADERPAWAMRFYGPTKARASETQVLADLVVVSLEDWVELLEELERLRRASEKEAD